MPGKKNNPGFLREFLNSVAQSGIGSVFVDFTKKVGEVGWVNACGSLVAVSSPLAAMGVMLGLTCYLKWKQQRATEAESQSRFDHLSQAIKLIQHDQAKAATLLNQIQADLTGTSSDEDPLAAIIACIHESNEKLIHELALDEVDLKDLWILAQDTNATVHKNSEKLDQILEYLKDKQPGEDPTKEPVPLDIQEAAEFVLEHETDHLNRARAATANRDFKQADAELAELKGINDRAFEYNTAKGDRYYEAGQFDESIDWYEKALTLKPNDFIARNNATLAHWQARLGSIETHQKRAIEIALQTLEIFPEDTRPVEWAATQNNLGIAYLSLPTGNRNENLQKAIACCESALRVWTEATHPVVWATTQNNLGNACAKLPTGNRSENLQRAIACYKSALRVWTETAHPVAWAATQNNLGNAYLHLPTGDRSENLQKAIDCYKSALRVRTETAHPVDWAMTQNNLGTAYSDLQTGDRSENLQKAIDCYKSALRVQTETAHPVDWAMTQNNLGGAYYSLPTGDRCENLRQAIACIENALSIWTETAFPRDHALYKPNLERVQQALQAECP